MSEPAKKAESKPAAPVLTADSQARLVALEQRERAIHQRELEIAEQRRALAEEYRLMRAQRAAPPPPPSRRAAAPADHRIRPNVQTSSPLRFDARSDEGFWDRVKRIMLGVSAS